MNAFRLFAFLLLVCSMVLAASAEVSTDRLVCRNFFADRIKAKCEACCVSKGFERELSISSSSIDGSGAGSCVCAKTVEDIVSTFAPEVDSVVETTTSRF